MKMITDYNQIDKKKWEEFVNNHPDGNIFQTPYMFNVYLKTNKHEPVIIAAINDQNHILGLLAGVTLTEHSGFLGKFSSRTIVTGGPLILENKMEIGVKVIQALNDYLGRQSIFTQFRNLFDLSFLNDKFQRAGYVYEDHLDILNDISTSTEEIKRNLKRSVRKNYNKAVNKGLKIKLLSEPDEIKASYILIQETYRRVKLPYPDYQFFQNLFTILHVKGLIKFFGAFFEEKLISVRIELTYKNQIYDYFTGSLEKHKNKYPNDFIPVEILVWGHINNFEVFDFGGAGKPNVPYGVRDYKLKFGGNLVNFGRFERINNKSLYLLGKNLLRIKKLLS